MLRVTAFDIGVRALPLEASSSIRMTRLGNSVILWVSAGTKMFPLKAFTPIRLRLWYPPLRVPLGLSTYGFCLYVLTLNGPHSPLHTCC